MVVSTMETTMSYIYKTPEKISHFFNVLRSIKTQRKRTTWTEKTEQYRSDETARQEQMRRLWRK